MGLFDKKYCSVCGEKIGLLGNRKLEDGNLCKNCARKLSPFFGERRHSTVDEIKRQLSYREINEKQLVSFSPDKSFGEGGRIYIETSGNRFIVTNSSNWRNLNPDIISFDQIKDVQTNIRENKEELFYEDNDGNRKSYNPRRYEYEYEFNVSLLIDSPWFDKIEIELSDGNRPDSRYCELYRNYEREMRELYDILLKKNIISESPADKASAADMAYMAGSWHCPSCGAENSGRFCEFCGSPKPV